MKPSKLLTAGLFACSVGCATTVPTPNEERALEATVAPPAATATAAPTVAPAKAEVPKTPQPITHTIDDIKLTFTLPSDAWRKHPGLGEPKPGISHIGFERDDVLDDTGHAVRPYCGITSEPVKKEDRDIVQYSLSWRLRAPFKVDSVFTHEDGTIQLKNAIGYIGKVTYEGNEHTVYVVHALFKDRGYVAVCDTTTSVLAKVKPELESIMKSMKHTVPL